MLEEGKVLLSASEGVCFHDLLHHLGGKYHEKPIQNGLILGVPQDVPRHKSAVLEHLHSSRTTIENRHVLLLRWQYCYGRTLPSAGRARARQQRALVQQETIRLQKRTHETQKGALRDGFS